MFWKKKQQAQKTYSEHDIIGALIQTFLNSGDIDPVFVRGIDSEEEADKNGENLPLVYIWHEFEKDGELHYNISINGTIVAQTLEALVPRSDPRFITLRDKAMAMFRDLSVNSVSAVCARTGQKPSVLFSR